MMLARRVLFWALGGLGFAGRAPRRCFFCTPPPSSLPRCSRAGRAAKRRPSGVDCGGNTTAVGISLDFPGLVEHILRILPRTTNIEVVTSNSPFERFWLAELRRDTQHFNDRVRFHWLNELPFDQIRLRLAGLPRNSVILYGLMVVDAAGVPYEQEHGLDVLRRESNAPIFGVFDNQLGRGIVGGPLYPYQEVSRVSAAVALRILNGAPAGSPAHIFRAVGTRLRLARIDALEDQ